MFANQESYQRRYSEFILQMARDAVTTQNPKLIATAFANAYAHKEVEQVVGELVREQLARFLSEYQPSGNTPERAVLTKIQEMGPANIPVGKSRQIGRARLDLHMIRGFRPRRMNTETFSDIYAPFDGSKFNFTWESLRRERIDLLDLAGRPVDIFIQGFPFANAHTLLFPDCAQGLPQWLDAALFQWVWALAEIVRRAGCSLGYNSRGAFASVNHFHVHALLGGNLLPVLAPDFAHNDGRVPYFVPCEVFDSQEKCWRWVEHQHRVAQPYNLLLHNGRVYCFARRHQSTYAHSTWTSGFAFFELSGAIIISDPNEFECITVAMVESEYRRVILQNGGE